MKIAIAGVWHVHADEYTRTAMQLGEVVGVYDNNPVWKSNFAEKFDIHPFATYEELLESNAEGIIVCAPTNKHTEFIIAAAKAGKHIFTEKVLALSIEDCIEIKDEIERNKVRFTISYPWKFNPGIMELKKAVDTGLVGKINYLRFRNCHNGSSAHWLPEHFYNPVQCGGGAMIDLGAHGMYLAHMFLGEPCGYNSTFTHFCRDEMDAVLNPHGLEDNAITVMSYESGAIAVNETGFVTVDCNPILEIGGEKGYLTYDCIRATLNQDGNTTELTLPAPSKSPLESFLAGKNSPGCDIEDAFALTRMMLGAYGSVK